MSRPNRNLDFFLLVLLALLSDLFSEVVYSLLQPSDSHPRETKGSAYSASKCVYFSSGSFCKGLYPSPFQRRSIAVQQQYKFRFTTLFEPSVLCEQALPKLNSTIDNLVPRSTRRRPQQPKQQDPRCNLVVRSQPRVAHPGIPVLPLSVYPDSQPSSIPIPIPV